MKINRLHLENYRIHENLDVEFDKGINLLLGDNGKGKSSILEAIGYALFGSDLRGTQKEAIQYGKKSGKILVEFTGIDGEEYIVTRRLPGGTTIYKKSNPELELQGKEERIRELCGIKGDIKDIYDNVIVAKQNEFISSFKATGKDREKIFDRVFNTEIYRKIYDGYSQRVESEYKTKIDIEKKSIENITEIMDNPQEIEENLKFEIERKEEFEKYLNNLIAEKKELKDKLNQINSIEIEIEKIKGSILQCNENIKNFNIQNEKLIKQIEESIEAKKVADENKDKYENYLENSNILQNKKRERKEIEKIAEDQNNLEKKLINLEKIKVDYSSQIELLKNKIENLKEDNNKNEIKEKSLKAEIEEKTKNIENYKIQLEKNKPLLSEIETYENKIVEWEDKIKIFKTSLKERKNNLNLHIEEKDQLLSENLDEKINEFEELEKNKRECEKERDQNISLGRANEEAYKKLKNSLCPFLNESCKNLSEKNINDFFINRRKEYTEIITRKNLEIEKISEKLKAKDEIIGKKIKLNSLEKDIELEKKDIELDAIKLKTGEEKLANKKNEYEKWKLENKLNNREELVSKNTELKTKIENENPKKNIDERAKLIAEINNNIYSIKELEKNKIEIEIKIKEVFQDEVELKNDVENNKPIVIKFQKLNQEIERYEILVNELKASNQLYLENYKKALEKEEFEKEIEKLKENLKKENTLLINYQTEFKVKENNIILMDKATLLIKESEKDSLIAETKEKIGIISGEVKNLKDKLIKIEDHRNKIEEKQKVVEKLEMKLELTKRFREKIKSMGKEVSKNMLKEIEILATENFRKITGRGEKVIWSNEDKDKYSVYLSGDRGELRFEQLSGGEQVAVAISIRGAMSELFTESRFSIFDEPTNNLDSERRRSLADSIGEILKNLEQSIIVTHDDTFREMAQKVIEL